MSKSADIKSFKEIADDLSLINGLPNKINSDYIKNIQQLILYRISEQRLSGKNNIIIDIPIIGTINVSISNPKADMLNLKPKDLSYEFKPSDIFLQDFIKILNNEGFELPEMLANKYGERILKAYNDYF